ncbi:MAG TPA: VCBS repeat-containing protein [Phycisphaeraceae bacterium]|nr:VCBS repeat-containing protein [Phycisphaeraceae bacterium]
MAKKRRHISPLLILPLALILVPLALLAFESHRTGLSWKDVISRIGRHAVSEEQPKETMQKTETGEKIDFLSDPIPIGAENPGEKHTIAHVAIYDLDQDGLNDVLVCDVLHRQIGWIRQFPAGTYTERKIGQTVDGPAHVEAYDMDKDGDLDVLVASMGVILPDNDRIGKVIVMENDGRQNFTNHVLAERIARVTDLQAGDMDGDGDIDLVAGQFGYDQGEIRWMENRGDWQFGSHILLKLSGTIHTPIVDFDNDGDLDVIALVSQEWEEIYCFENNGKGKFKTRLLYGAADADYSSSGIGLADMDQDGDVDILWANGDAFVATDYRPLPTHGMQWLENVGDMKVKFHRLGHFNGAYDPCAADFDGDGDPDVLAVSAFNYWNRPGTQSMMWWQNMGNGRFVGRDLAEEPTHLITCDVADMNGDGKIDIVTGSMNLYPPFDRIGRVTLFLNKWQKNENN